MNIQKNLQDYISAELDYWNFSGVVRVVQRGRTLFETSRGYSNIAFGVKKDGASTPSVWGYGRVSTRFL